MWSDTHQWILSSLSGSDASEIVAVLCLLEQVLQATATAPPSLVQRTSPTMDQTLESSLETSCHLDFFQVDRKCNHQYFWLEVPLVLSSSTCGQRIQAALKDVLCVAHKQNGKIPRINLFSHNNHLLSTVAQCSPGQSDLITKYTIRGAASVSKVWNTVMQNLLSILLALQVLLQSYGPKFRLVFRLYTYIVYYSIYSILSPKRTFKSWIPTSEKVIQTGQ